MECCHEVIFEFTTHRPYSSKRKTRAVEHIFFQSQPWSSMTKALERTVLELRQHMSIRAVANYFHLHCHTVKDLEKQQLKKKCRKIQAVHIKAIGMDEIMLAAE